MNNALDLSRVSAAMLLAACGSLAQAQGVGVNVKLLDFDLTQPAREEYRDAVNSDRVISTAVERAWEQLSAQARDQIKGALEGPNKLGDGMTAREFVIALGVPGAMQLASTGHSSGKLTIPINGNAIDLTTTHPLSQGPSMDPRVRVAFDMTLTIDFRLVGQAPHVRASEAVLQLGNGRVLPLNGWAAIGFAFSNIEAQLRSVLNGKVPVTNRVNEQLRSQATLLSLPSGYIYNGGRVEPGRVIIAGYKVKPANTARVAVVAAWPKTLGELMNDCGPVGIGAKWQSGPRPFNGEQVAPTAVAQVQNINYRVDRGVEFACSAVLLIPQGAPLSFTWAEPIRHLGGHRMVMTQVLVAKPDGWVNPVVPKDDDYKLALSMEARAGTGLQLNPHEQARRSPIDPVAKGGSVRDRINPNIRVNDQKARVQPGEAVMLNPQPLPPRAVVGKDRAAAPVQPGEAVMLNPQPLPPRAVVGKDSAATPALRGGTVMLNPQPLPPRTNAFATPAQPASGVTTSPGVSSALRARNTELNATQAPASSLAR